MLGMFLKDSTRRFIVTLLVITKLLPLGESFCDGTWQNIKLVHSGLLINAASVCVMYFNRKFYRKIQDKSSFSCSSGLETQNIYN